jgi:hypothetical protein
MWIGAGPEAQVNDCVTSEVGCEPGRFLVFSSYGQLTADDADAARDVYRYDAQTEALVRVSVGEAGHGANGNEALDPTAVYNPTGQEGTGEFIANATIAASEFGGARHGLQTFQDELHSRAVSDDGSRIVFMTSSALSPFAVNGQPDVYEWHEGGTGLISSGLSESEDFLPTITPSGRDVFFATAAGLVPQDTEGDGDFYDARIGGGFAVPQAPQERCSGDACQGPLSTPGPLLVAGSVVQPPGGNLPITKTPAKHKRKPQKRRKKARKSGASGLGGSGARHAVRGSGHGTRRAGAGRGGRS